LERIAWSDGLDQYRLTHKGRKQKFKELARCQAMSGNSSLVKTVLLILLIVDLQVTKGSSVTTPTALTTWWGKGRCFLWA
jgi:hypothetical protein